MKDRCEPRHRWLAVAIVIAWQAVSSRPAAAQDGQGGSVIVSGGWAQAVPPEARESRGFLVVRNTGAMTARLVSAWSPDVEAVRLLERDPVSATAFRSPPEGFSIPPDGTLTMEPGGPHLALDGLRQPPGPGNAISVFLRFERAGEIAVELRGHDH